MIQSPSDLFRYPIQESIFCFIFFLVRELSVITTIFSKIAFVFVYQAIVGNNCRLLMLYYQLYYYYYYLTILAPANILKIYSIGMAMSVTEPNTSLLRINVTFIESCAMLVRVKHQLVSAILCNIIIKLLFWGTSLIPTTVFPKIHMDVM